MGVRRILIAGVLVSLAAVWAGAARERGGAPAVENNARARAEAARKVYEGSLARFGIDARYKPEIEHFHLWSRRWMEAEREAAGTKAERTAAAQGHLGRMKKWAKLVEQDNKAGGTFSGADVAATEFYCLEAEAWLAQEKAR